MALGRITRRFPWRDILSGRDDFACTLGRVVSLGSVDFLCTVDSCKFGDLVERNGLAGMLTSLGLVGTTAFWAR